MAIIDKLELKVCTKAIDEETIILFDLLKKIKSLEEELEKAQKDNEKA